MAGASGYPAALRAQNTTTAAPKPSVLPMQKKILENVLECIVQLKSDFFESHEIITDDSIVLQRFCAKFEHFLQIGMKEKVSLLGRKKDYWDYFCECLGSSKGVNDGIKYVKSLGENKTSLGRGRAFLRFCLVHQRLADMMQLCVVSEKTIDWFVPGTLMTSHTECQQLINSLYDLNSMHFDLSPRGYDLDTSWPAFANRKNAGSNSWNVPISRRSSMTSMDTISQSGMSIDNFAEVDRLAKDLESAHTATSDLVGQIGTLQQEKAAVSQSAWTTQGELQASREQLSQLQTQHAELLAKYQELDMSHVKIKLEKEHQEKAHADKLKTLNAKFEEEESRRVSQLAAEEEVWKRERQEEAARAQREVDRVADELGEATRRADVEQARAEEQAMMLRDLLVEVDIKSENGDYRTSISSLAHSLKSMQHKLVELSQEKSAVQSQLQGEQSDKGKQLSLLEGRLLEQEKALQEAKESTQSLQTQMTTVELELKGEQEKSSRLLEDKTGLESRLREKEAEHKDLEEKFSDLRSKVAGMEVKNESLSKERDYLKTGVEKAEALSGEIKQQHEEAKLELGKTREDADKRVLELAQKCESLSSQLGSQTEEVSRLQQSVRDKDAEVETLARSSQGETSELQDLLLKKDKELSQVKTRLEEVSEKLETVSKEAAEAGDGNLVLTEKLFQAEGEAETLRMGYRDVEGKVVDLEKEVEKMIEELREKHGRLTEAESQGTVLKEALEEKMNVVESLRSEIEKLGQEVKVTRAEKETELEAMKVELKAAVVEKEELRRDMDVEKTRMLGLLRESEGVKRSESEKEEKISSLILEMESLRREKEADMTQLEERARVLNAQINDKDRKISELSREKEDACTEMEQERARNKSATNKDEQIKELEEKIQASETRFRDTLTKMDSRVSEERQLRENETASFTERIKWLETQLVDKEKSHNASCLDYETKITELIKTRDDLMSASSESLDNLARLSTEAATLAEDKTLLATKLEAVDAEKKQTQSQMAELTEQLVHLRVDLEGVTEEKSSLKMQVDTMAEELTKVENHKDELQRQTMQLLEKLREAEDEAQEKLAQKREVELKLDDAESRLLKVESKLEEAELTQQSYQKTQFSSQVLEESLLEARKTLEDVRAERSLLQDKFDQLTSQKEELQTRLEEVELQRKEMSEQVEAMSKQISSPDQSDVEKLSEQLDEERKKSKMTMETLNEEISALQFQLSAEQMQKNDVQTATLGEAEERVKSELRARISDQEIIIEKLEQELEESRKVKESDSSQVSVLEKKVEKAQERLKSAENRQAQMSTRLEQEMSERQKLEAELTSLRTTFSQSIEEKVAVIRNLESDNAQYKKKLIKLIKDKDSLWQKTDRLVDAQKRKSEERWQDNSEATHCPQCKTEFSLFVRKHHCRLCGRIYCWACSDFWLDSTLSSKKVRCCKVCYDNHNEDGSAQLSASMVNNESDDEDDDEEENEAEGKNVQQRNGILEGSPGIADSSRPEIVSPSLTQTDHTIAKLRTSNASSSWGDNVVDHDDEDANYDDDGGDDTDNIYDQYDDSIDSTSGTHRSQKDAQGARSANYSQKPLPGGSLGDGNKEDDCGDEDVDFQVVSQEEIVRSMSQYSSGSKYSASVPSNMSSSMVLSADELEAGEVNQQNEVWVKPGKTFVVPVDIEERNTVLHWSFTSQPKDIVFSVTYRADDSVELSSVEEIVAPCKCDSHKQTVRGELTAKQAGIYSLVFDNTYSRLTSKKVHYWLEYRKNV